MTQCALAEQNHSYPNFFLHLNVDPEGKELIIQYSLSLLIHPMCIGPAQQQRLPPIC